MLLFGTVEVMTLLQHLSSVAIEAMTFLESGGDVMASESGTDAEADDQMHGESTTVADAGTGGMLMMPPVETQTTTTAGSTSPSTAGALHDGGSHPGPAAEDDEHVLHQLPGVQVQGQGHANMSTHSTREQGVSGHNVTPGLHVTSRSRRKGPKDDPSLPRTVQQQLKKYMSRK